MRGYWNLNYVSFRFKEDGAIEIATKDLDVALAILENQRHKNQCILNEMAEEVRKVDSLREDQQKIDGLSNFLKNRRHCFKK